MTYLDCQVLLRMSAPSTKGYTLEYISKASAHDSTLPGAGGSRVTGSTKTKEENNIELFIAARALETTG